MLLIFYFACVFAWTCVDVNVRAEERPPYQTVIHRMRESEAAQAPAQIVNTSRVHKFEEIRKHLLSVLRTPDWREEFYRLIRLVNSRSNVPVDHDLTPTPTPTPTPRNVSRQTPECCTYQVFERRNASRFVHRSATAGNPSLARRLAARARRGRTVRCPQLYQEAYCVYGDCELSLNYNMLICRCPLNASGEFCELRKLSQCYDHSGRRVVEQRRKSNLYSKARQPTRVIIEHSMERAPLTLRTNEEVPCSRNLCENRGDCTEVPGVTFHCECDDGYREKTCNTFVVYYLLRELWEAEYSRRIAQNEDIDLVETELRLIDGFADSVCAQRWDGRCRDSDDLDLE